MVTDYLDLLDMYAFDVEKTAEVVKGMLDEIGLEKMESKPHEQVGWRLRGKGSSKGVGGRLGNSVQQNRVGRLQHGRYAK